MQSLPFDIACFCKTGQHASDEQSEWTVSLSLCSGILSEFGLRVRNVEFNLWLWGGHRLRIAFSSIAICGVDHIGASWHINDACLHTRGKRPNVYMCGYIVDRWIGVAFWSGGHRYSLAMMRINGYDSLLVDSHSWIRTQTVIVIALEYVAVGRLHTRRHTVYIVHSKSHLKLVCVLTATYIGPIRDHWRRLIEMIRIADGSLILKPDEERRIHFVSKRHFVGQRM